MLGPTAEQCEPTAILASESHDQNQDPVAGSNKKNRQEKVADQQRAGPVAMLAAELEVIFREDSGRPFRSECPTSLREITADNLDPFPYQVEWGFRVDDGRQLPEEKHHANLAHFYKLFAARFGTTPRRYRMQARLIVGRNSLGKQNSKKA